MQRNKDSRIQIIFQVTLNEHGTQPWRRFLHIFSVKWEGRNVKAARISTQYWCEVGFFRMQQQSLHAAIWSNYSGQTDEKDA